MDKYKKLATNTIIFAIGTFSSKILSFLLLPYVTRIMGTGDYGAADLVQQTGNVLIPIMILSINNAGLRFALDKKEDRTQIFSIGIKTVLRGFLIFLLLAYPLSLINIKDFHLGDYIVLIYVFILCSAMRQLCQHFVRGCGRVKLYAVDGIVATATTLAFTILFLGVFKWGVNGYIIAIVASDFCSVVFLFWRAKLYKLINFKKITKQKTKEMLSYSAPLIPTAILWWIINVSDRYMVTGFNGLDANGLYTAASKIPNFLMLFATIFVDAWQLSAIEDYDSEKMVDFFSKVFKTFSSGIFAIASILICTCQIITVILVAKSYYDSWQYVPALIIATAFSCLVNFLASVYMAEKKTVMSFITALLGAVTNIGLNFVLIPLLGPNGAALATIASFFVIFFARAIDTRRFIKIKIPVVKLGLMTAILAAQSGVMLHFKSGFVMYAIEIGLVLLMILVNIKELITLAKLLIEKFLKKKNNNTNSSAEQ